MCNTISNPTLKFQDPTHPNNNLLSSPLLSSPSVSTIHSPLSNATNFPPRTVAGIQHSAFHKATPTMNMNPIPIPLTSSSSSSFTKPIIPPTFPSAAPRHFYPRPYSYPYAYASASSPSPSPSPILSFRIPLKPAAAAAADDVSNTSTNDDQQDTYQEYEVEIEQPYGLKFAKGSDGATYIDAIAPGFSADKTGLFTVGDKVIATSAVFGTEIWPAAEYGRTMYTIRQRIGPLFMKMQKRFGNLDYGTSQLSEKEIIRAERNSGFISNRVREIQLQNYQKNMEQKQVREKELGQGLQLYKAGKYEEAREKFESVLGSMPTPDEASVASYNVACCYSKLNQIQAGLSALEDALQQGYEDFKRIRTDPDLANLRTSPAFETLMKRFDESFINESAVNAIKSLFGLFNKK